MLQSAAIGYGRRYLDPALTPADQAKQTTLLCTYAENAYTNAVLADDRYRTPLPAQSSSYELIQLQPSANQAGLTNLFGFEELQAIIQAAGDGAHEIAFENLNPSGLNAGQPYRRLLERTRALYRPDDMGAAAADPNALLPAGKTGISGPAGQPVQACVHARSDPAGLPTGRLRTLACTCQCIGKCGPDGGAYVDLDGDDSWWMPSGRVFHFPTATTPAAEKTEAKLHFYVPRRFVDPFGNAASVDYDADDLLIVKTIDAATNTVTATYDYRVLAPVLLTDPNGNRAAAVFDILGMVAGTSIMGKTTENLGDSFSTFTADLTSDSNC